MKSNLHRVFFCTSLHRTVRQNLLNSLTHLRVYFARGLSDLNIVLFICEFVSGRFLFLSKFSNDSPSDCVLPMRVFLLCCDICLFHLLVFPFFSGHFLFLTKNDGRHFLCLPSLYHLGMLFYTLLH